MRPGSAPRTGLLLPPCGALAPDRSQHDRGRARSTRARPTKPRQPASPASPAPTQGDEPAQHPPVAAGGRLPISTAVDAADQLPVQGVRDHHAEELMPRRLGPTSRERALHRMRRVSSHAVRSLSVLPRIGSMTWLRERRLEAAGRTAKAEPRRNSRGRRRSRVRLHPCRRLCQSVSQAIQRVAITDVKARLVRRLKLRLP